MDLSFLRPLYARPGPWASVYADASRDAEDGAAAFELRLRGLTGRAVAAPADASAPAPAAVSALADAMRERETRPGRYGLAGFAAAPDAVFVYALPAPPRADLAAVGPLPHAMPLVAQRGEDVAWVRVVAGRTGADLEAVDAGGMRRHAAVRGGETFPIRKVKGAQGWSHKHFQQAAEEAWKHNAGDEAAATAQLAETVGADVIVVAGDIRARELLAERLPARWRDRVVPTEGGGGEIDDATATAVAEVAARRAADALDRFGAQQGAANGLPAVVAALQKAQVETLLLVDDPSSTDRAWIGPEPGHLALDRAELEALGVERPEPTRADAALVRALVGTDADLILVGPDEAPLDGGVGAVLRWRDG
jgi:hypothetical protein